MQTLQVVNEPHEW